jgi:hypothetical protein
MSEKNEKPILFSTPMVQAILEGRKTMTRRIVKPQPLLKPGDMLVDMFDITEVKCPYGKVGDVLWVREKFTTLNCLSKNKVSHQTLLGWVREHPNENPYIYFADKDVEHDLYMWKPSIHMPKTAARIWLDITNIRVDRVQDISEEDAIAEGIEGAEGKMGYKYYIDKTAATFHPNISFQSLWESINGEDSWNENPWVWVVEFKRIEPKSIESEKDTCESCQQYGESNCLVHS